MKQTLLLFYFFQIQIFAQTISFEKFLVLNENSLVKNSVLNISKFLPEEYSITAYDVGDFSGDSINDFAIGIKPKKQPNKKIMLYYFVKDRDFYELAFTDTTEYFESTIEIGFTIENNICFLTHKVDKNHWTISGYTFLNGDFKLVDQYESYVDNFNSQKLTGIEMYTNYADLTAFSGFYRVSNLKQISKHDYFIYPAYQNNRNIYKSYSKGIAFIASSESVESDEIENNYILPSSYFVYDDKFLIMKIFLSKSLIENLVEDHIQKIILAFDINSKRLSEPNVKGSSTKSKSDPDLAFFDINFNLSQLNKTTIEFTSGNNYSEENLKGLILTYSYDAQDNLIFNIYLPLKFFSNKIINTGIGNFTRLSLQSENKKILLTNSYGEIENPRMYAKLLFIEPGKFFGSVYNKKFEYELNKLRRNGIITY